MWWATVIITAGLAAAVVYAIIFSRRMFSGSGNCGCGHATCEKNNTGTPSENQSVKVIPLVELKTPDQQE